MDSPSLQSAPAPPSHHPSRLRSHTSFSAHSTINDHGGIQKRVSNNDRNRSISVSQADRLYRLAAEQSSDLPQGSISSSVGGIQWITPQHSPQPHPFKSEASIAPFAQWAAEPLSPPRSDSGIPSVCIDSTEEPIATTGISDVAPEFAFDQSAVSAEMSSLGFLLPSQYGAAPYESSNYSMDQNQYIPPMRMSQPTVTSGAPAYAQTASSNPSLYQHSRAPDHSRRHSELPAPSASPYDQNYRRVSSPYEGGYSMASGQTIPSISGLTQSPMSSPALGQTTSAQIMSHYDTSRSPSLYQPNPYGPAYTTAPSNSQHYAQSQSVSYPPPYSGSGGSSSVNEVLSKPMDTDSSIRVLNQRPKPQCWEHGCNGRQFSTFSNLLRHQREKSGTASKSYCPKCGAEFTRTTARNGHLAHDKCTKQQPQQHNPSEDGK